MRAAELLARVSGDDGQVLKRKFNDTEEPEADLTAESLAGYIHAIRADLKAS